MKRTLFKGQKQPKLRQNRSEGCDLPTVASPDFSSGVDEQRTMTMIGESESLHALPQSNYAEDNTTTCDMTQKKKEKLGIFRTLRRRFKTNFLKKTDESDSNHIEEYCQNSTTAVTVKGESKRHKQSARCKVNLCTKPSNSNSSHSSESLDLNIPIQRCQKVDEFQSNKDGKDLDLLREKASCKSKDISKFQGDSCCECGVETNCIDHSSRRCQKICNLNQSCVQIHSENHILGRYDRSTDKPNSHPQTPSDTGQKFGIQADSNGLSLMEPQKVWSLTQELFRLSKFGWYWGPITRREAERKLAGQPDGAFLVRDSSDERYLLSLSFRSYGRTLHTRIEHCNGKFIFDAQPDTEGYPSIVDLIENSMNDPQTGICSYSRRGSPSPPIYPVRLTKPVSRFTQVRSLQYLCRFVIRQYTRYDHIQELPLPTSIKGWIGENQYSS
ncbi:hypothetical protein ACJMK2_010861 [Sinanodonta woodiana]|uniref:Suppressor of cytokine signaling 6 n=1 Tax=Sinanodonta woodiana TaxID=1069815 RepID=A0ABD3VGT4_SINWO